MTKEGTLGTFTTEATLCTCGCHAKDLHRGNLKCLAKKPQKQLLEYPRTQPMLENSQFPGDLIPFCLLLISTGL